MTQDINRFAFLLRQKPICTQSPIKQALGSERHRELRAHYKLELGIDLLDDRCDNTFNCKTLNQGCAGRPFPKDPEILKALQTLNVTVHDSTHKGREVYKAEAIVECNKCPFRVGCEASCATQDSYLRRNIKPESNPPENTLVPYDDFEKGMYKALSQAYVEHCSYGEWVEEDLPLDCLSHQQRRVMEMVIEGLEQPVIAHKLGIGQQRVSTHKARAIARMTEFGRARKVIQEKGAPQRVVDYYVNNLTQQEIATKEQVERSTIAKSLNSWLKLNLPK